MDPWLRGPIPGIAPIYQPAAHALVQALEDAERALEGLTPDQIWARPGGAASVGFHAKHLVGALDRLLTYAQGRALDERQRAWLAAEGEPGAPPADAVHLLDLVRTGVRQGLEVLRSLPADLALTPREVGRQRLPTTVLGAAFHAGEHSARHAGQMVTTARLVGS